MELGVFFKSIIDQDKCSVVICNLAHEIIYMNPSACKNYAKRGGEALVGKNLLACHNEHSAALIKKLSNGLQRIKSIILFIPFTMKSRIRMYI